jgi:predicted nucleotidyltransferase
MADTQYLPESARAALDASDISLTKLIEMLALGCGSALLLVGSHAAGTATSTSDLDFLILFEGDAEYAGPREVGSLHMSADLVERHLALVGGREVDIEILRGELLLPLTASLGRMHLLSSSPAEAFENFQVLENIELRIIERLRTGIPLSGHEQIGRWRASLLFPDSSMSADDYIDDVYRAAADLFNFFRRDGQYPGLAEGIRWFG